MPCFQHALLHVDENDQHGICMPPKTSNYTKDVSLAISMAAFLRQGPASHHGFVAWRLRPACRQ